MRAARLLLIVGLLAALAAAAPVARQTVHAQGPGREQDDWPLPPWAERLKTWVTAVVQHEPGKPDEPARTIGPWSEPDLHEVLAAIITLRAILKRDGERLAILKREGESFTQLRARSPTIIHKWPFIRHKNQEVSLGVLVEVLDLLAGEEVKRGDMNRLLRRGALLHADIAMLSQSSPTDGQSATRQVMLATDGRAIGYRGSPFHWEFGRGLLDALTPDPAQDETARLWYHATSTYLLSTSDMASVEPHLDHALRLFPTDADILFECGYFREVFASPLLQSTVQSVAALNRRFISASASRSADAQLRDAEDLFRRAIRANPGLTEAHVRLAHVLSARGRYAEAAPELRGVLEASPEPHLRYYAELLLGDAEQALGRRRAARESYERAAALYPLAQSPYLALSQLARRSGDRAGALRSIQSVLSLPPASLFRSDPWWTYGIWQSRSADDLLLALHRRALSEERR